MKDPALVRRNLWHWTLHVVLGASGSFACALADQWRKPEAVIGMVAGVLVFIALYTTVWSSAWFSRRVPPGSIKAKALLHATRLRSALASLCCLSVTVGVGLKNLPPFFAVLVLPEVIPALLLGLGIDTLRRSAWFHAVRVATGGPDAHQRAQSIWIGDVSSLLPTFVITLAQGFALSVMLLVFTLGISAVLLVMRSGKLPAGTQTKATGALT